MRISCLTPRGKAVRAPRAVSAKTAGGGQRGVARPGKPDLHALAARLSSRQESPSGRVKSPDAGGLVAEAPLL
eukprot:8588883-Pyramimonas_sp.AAC.1